MANPVLTRAIQQGLISIWRSPARKQAAKQIGKAAQNIRLAYNSPTGEKIRSEVITHAGNVGKIAVQRQSRHLPIRPGVDNYAISQVALKLKDLGVNQTKKFVTTHPALNNAYNNVTGAFAERYVNTGARFQNAIGWGAYVDDGHKTKQAINAAYNSKLGRGTRFGVNRFIVDYATFQVINLATQAIEEIDAKFGPTPQQDEFTITPFDADLGAGVAAGQQIEQGDRSFGEQFTAVAISALIGTAASRGVGKFRRHNVTLSTVTKSNAKTLGARLGENTLYAQRIYGNRYPEVIGGITGSSAALFALGGSPQEVAVAMGVRGLTNATVGFYNAGKPKQGTLPLMGPPIKSRIKSIKKLPPHKAIKKVNKDFTTTYRKTKQTYAAAMWAQAKPKGPYDPHQGALF